MEWNKDSRPNAHKWLPHDDVLPGLNCNQNAEKEKSAQFTPNGFEQAAVLADIDRLYGHAEFLVLVSKSCGLNTSKKPIHILKWKFFWYSGILN